MTSTTHADLGENTEAIDVAKAFAGHVQGKTILVTGVNLKELDLLPQKPFLAKLQESTDALKAKYPGVDYRHLQLDLSSQKAVRDAATELLSWNDLPAVDIIVNNAGIMNLPERTINDDGIELTFATNHIGHFLFTSMIMPKLITASESKSKGATRIVNVSSHSPTWSSMRWSDMNFEKVNKDLSLAEQPPYEVHKAWGAEDPENATYLPLESYNQSKVANLLFSIGANNRLYEKHGILSLTVHPGVIMTELGRNTTPEVMAEIKKMAENKVLTFRTPGAGAATSVVVALDPKLGKPEPKHGKENFGSYLMDCQISDQAMPLAESNTEAEKLWKRSEGLVGQEFVW